MKEASTEKKRKNNDINKVISDLTGIVTEMYLSRVYQLGNILALFLHYRSLLLQVR